MQINQHKWSALTCILPNAGEVIDWVSFIDIFWWGTAASFSRSMKMPSNQAEWKAITFLMEGALTVKPKEREKKRVEEKIGPIWCIWTHFPYSPSSARRSHLPIWTSHLCKSWGSHSFAVPVSLSPASRLSVWSQSLDWHIVFIGERFLNEESNICLAFWSCKHGGSHQVCAIVTCRRETSWLEVDGRSVWKGKARYSLPLGHATLIALLQLWLVGK